MSDRKELTVEELINLADRTNAFAKEIIGDWTDTFRLDATGFQYRYIYSNAFRAAVSAQSFWLLHSRRRFHDAQIIARTLLERIVNGRVAAISPERACSLLATDRQEELEKVRKIRNFDPTNFDTAQIQAQLDLYQQEIDKFLKMASRSDVLTWNFAEMCKEVQLEWAYRMLYASFSDYTHASYGVGTGDPSIEEMRIALHIALLAPMDTSTQYDRVFHGKERSEISQKYTELYNEFSDLLLVPRC
jgi:hypothetical protein